MQKKTKNTLPTVPYKRDFKTFMWYMFSENGSPSSKRIIGSLMIIVALGCTVYLTIRDGGTSVVEGLLQTILIVGTSLLGLYSVTSIWKGGRASTNMQPPENVTIDRSQTTNNYNSSEKKCDEENDC